MSEHTSENITDSNSTRELKRLKDLLFGEETANLNDLHHRITNPQQRTEDVALILPDSIKAASRDKESLALALKAPVDECIRSLVKSSPEEFADSLFPVMGPAIRKSIRETLRSFLQSMNKMLEQSMSAKALKWRWEAKRTGVPFSQIVLKHSLIYRIDEVLLIQQSSGLMISHVSHPQGNMRDSDAVLAMVTVIQDFARDSFSANPDDTIETFVMGEQTVWWFDGPKAHMACVISGIVPISKREYFQSVLESLHLHHEDYLENFNGDQSGSEPINRLLEKCLTQEAKDTELEHRADHRHWLLKPINLVLILATAATLYWLIQHYFDTQRVNSLRERLEQTPGVIVFDIDKDDGRMIVKGMVDPLVGNLSEIVDSQTMPENDIDFQMALYHSLDPALALQRANEYLQPPESVILKAEGHSLSAHGSAPEQWLQHANRLRSIIPGFTEIDLSAVEVAGHLNLEAIRQHLQAPPGISLELDDRILHVSGSAPLKWIKNFRQTEYNFDGIDSIGIGKVHPLVAEELTKATALIGKINMIKVQFNDDTELTPEGRNSLRMLVKQTELVNTLARQLEMKLAIDLTGFADGLGAEKFNDQLKLERATFIKQQLVAVGIPANSIVLKPSNQDRPQRIRNLGMRRVEVFAALKTKGHGYDR